MDKESVIPDASGITTSEERRGRPSANQQIDLEAKIWRYFIDCISVPTAARELGVDVKTVRRYYRHFSEIRISMNDDEFIEQCKINIESGVCSIDDLILKQRKSLNQLEAELASQKSRTHKEDYQLRRELRDTAKSIANMTILKTNLANSPTADIKLNGLAKELIANIVP